MPEQSDRQPSKLILPTLVRALTHRLRTPLSVISNELQSIKMSHPNIEVELCLKRLTQMSDLLKTIGQFSRSLQSFEDLELTPLVSEILSAKSAPAQLKVIGSPATIRTDRKALTLVIASIIDLLRETSSQLDADDFAVILTSTQGKPALSIKTRNSSFSLHDATDQFSSLSEYFCDVLDRDTFLAPCIDFTLNALGISLEIRLTDSLELALLFES